MIAVISPAKTLDFETTHDVTGSAPRFPKETERLVKTLRRKKEKDLQSMMSISDKIAQLNVERYQVFQGSTNPEIARPAIYAFKGDVYLGLDAETLNEDTILRAQDH
ncbi:MAG: peroxide stress protein YaaA, partial [Bacteroidota bacterium]